MNTYTFHIKGMHCAACILLTESEVSELSHISYVKSDLSHHTIEVGGEFGDRSPEQIAQELTTVLLKHGYSVSVEKEVVAKKWEDFKVAVPITLGFVALFVLLQKMGLVNLVSTGNVTYGTAIMVGVIASLSTCMAVVGGLLLSMSATFAKEGNKVRPQVLFHIGRLVSFFVLGGVIGSLGAVFALSVTATFIISLVIGLVMLVLGINLLDVFHWSKRFTPAMPQFLAKRAYGVAKFNHSLTPLLVGVATFFLPCGFTQAMQVYTLGTKSFMGGALTMGAFALGTFPVLALVSFSSLSIKDSKYAGVFFKTAGLIVILFALFNLINSAVVIGFINPVFSF